MKIQVTWELEFPRERIHTLNKEAEERGLGDVLELSQSELVSRLMMDAGSDVIEQLLQDPANVSYRLISRDMLQR